jgi:hypothetical protein
MEAQILAVGEEHQCQENEQFEGCHICRSRDISAFRLSIMGDIEIHMKSWHHVEKAVSWRSHLICESEH